MSTPSDLYQTIGALEIGVWVSTFLYGCQTFQTYFYFTRRSTNDPLGMRLGIAVLWLAELAHTASASQTIWSMTTTDFGHPERLTETHSLRGLYVSVLIADFVGPAVQAFYAWRIRRFSGSYYVSGVCLLLLFARVLAGVGLMALGFRSSNIGQFEQMAPWLFLVVMILSAVTDVLIASAMCYYLRQKRQNSFRRTAALLDRLMYWTVQTGLLTSLATLFELALFIAMRSTFVWIAPQLTITKLYSNTLLATLNGRETLRRMDKNNSNLAVTIDTVIECDRADGSPMQPPHPVNYAIELRPESRKEGVPCGFEDGPSRAMMDSKSPAV
ncbi:hypothetical protein PLICRDRAFT_94383 [Plicaturopsis crispa FD-325 SS-3]|nr:hypothetical protein PLICRDRAFT_94383 [Plicaturopsis crispa FD-325 SS-3]